MPKLKFLAKYLHQYKWWYIGGFLSLGLTTWISVSIPEYIQHCIDLIAGGRLKGQNEFIHNILIIAGMAVILILIRTLSRILIFIPARLIERQIKGEMFLKLSSFGKEYYDKNSSGNILSRINNDISGMRLICGFGALQIGNILFSLSMTPYKMWKLSPALTLYCTIPMVVVFVIVRISLRIMVKNTNHRMSTLQNLSGKTISALSGNSVIKSFNLYRWAENRVWKENSQLFSYTLKIAWIRSFIMPLLSNLGQILKVLILSIGGYYAIKSRLTIGQLTAYIAYAALLSQPIMGLGWVLTIIQQGFVGITSIQTILNRKGEDEQLTAIADVPEDRLKNQEIKVNHLTYTYHDGSHPALKDISFRLKPGQVVGITGKVGAGKTTLINCLNGYLRPEKGHIYIGKHDAADLPGSAIRSSIRTVSQEVFLFSDTIKNNVEFGSAGAPFKHKLDEVIYKSAFADELERFPEKEKTLVGEKGIMLSGGQKQRISLARALYTPCELLILDDVFSAVDSDTERFLIREIFENHSAKSILTSSTRISVLRKTDFIIVLEDGQITAVGPHEQLIKESEFYRELNLLQKGK